MPPVALSSHAPVSSQNLPLAEHIQKADGKEGHDAVLTGWPPRARAGQKKCRVALGDTGKTSSTTSIEDMGLQEERADSPGADVTQARDGTTIPASSSFSVPASLQWFSKCGLGTPRGPQGQNYFHNNTKKLFALFLSCCHEYTVGFSRGYLREPQLPKKAIKSLLPFPTACLNEARLPIYV